MRIHPLLRMTEVSEWVSGNFQPAARASMLKNPIGISSIGLGYTPIENYTSEIAARGITTNLTAGTMAFGIYGVFQLVVSLNLTHDESNQGRETNVRFWNVTDGVESGNIPIFIARNQPGTNFTDAFEVEVTASELGKAFRLEVGGGDIIGIEPGTNIVDYATHMTSEWRGFESAEERFA